MQLSGAPAGEKPKFSLPDFILAQSRAIEKLFILLVILSVIAAPFVEVNYDLTEYLPDTVQSKQGLDLMEEKFGYPGTARVMIEDVTLYQAKLYKDELEAVDGVDQILWLDMGTDIYSSSSFINSSDIAEYYKD